MTTEGTVQGLASVRNGGGTKLSSKQLEGVCSCVPQPQVYGNWGVGCSLRCLFGLKYKAWQLDECYLHAFCMQML